MRDVALGTAFLVPGIVFAVVFGINMLFWIIGSTGGTPVIAFILLLLVWFLISMPLCYIGAQIGARGKRVEPTTRYSSICREIPPQVRVSLSLSHINARNQIQDGNDKVWWWYKEPERCVSCVAFSSAQSTFFGTPMCLAAGGLPFGVLSVELLFILNSLWQSEIYIMFGFLFFVFLIVLTVSAETSVVVTYVELISEDYRW